MYSKGGGDNGERMNRTLVERVRCLLSHAGLPASFWGEALNTAVHVINLTPCVPLRFDVPDRMKDQKLIEEKAMFVPPVLVQDELGVLDEDQTLKDVEKTEKETIPQHNDDPIDLDPVPPKHFDAQFGDDEEQNDEEHDADDVDAQEQPNLDEDVHPELPAYVTICST
ncbi:retrovirus-related pol polyprotein from transposon TNT 1-94 [Tanacetum coccineum]